MLKSFAVALLLTAIAQPVLADEPDGLKLPYGFHAQVVDEGTGPGARHIAIRGGHLYISTRKERGATTEPGVIAMDIAGDHKASGVQHFSTVNDGTGIRFYKGALYVASPSTVYRFKFKGNELAGLPNYRIARLGLGYVPEHRDIFPGLTVRQNLLLGVKDVRRPGKWKIEGMLEMFPNLAARADTPAGVLSGAIRVSLS